MARHLSDEDLEILGIWLAEHVLTEVLAIKETLMALADTLAQLQTEVPELKADVDAFIANQGTLGTQITDLQAQIADLQTQLANGTISADQLTALQATADDLAATHAEAVAALPAPVPTDPGTGDGTTPPTDPNAPTA